MPRPSRAIEVWELLPPAIALALPRGQMGKRGQIKHLMAALGLAQDWQVGRYLHQLHDADMAYIGCWARATGGAKTPSAVWVEGKGVHAPRPEPLPATTIDQRYVKNRRKAVAAGLAGRIYDDRYDIHVKRALANDAVQHARAAPVTWLSALGA